MNTSRMQSLRRWVDSYAAADRPAASPDRRIDWLRAAPFIALHLGCLGVFLVGWSPVAVATAVALYCLRMLAVTAFYHRYFSHRAFHASRAAQLVFAILGATAVQRGPLWWAAHHRLHHARSDRPQDTHSPRHQGFLWSHMGWFLSQENFATRLDRVPDLARYPELRFIDRFDALVPAVFAAATYAFGAWLETNYPHLGTNGWQMLVWGFAVSTVVLYHMTFTINSVAHRIGSRAFDTADDSRNNAVLAILTFGEGWHNNHHFYPGSARQGFRWWQVDLTYAMLRLLAAAGVISKLRPVPGWVLAAANKSGGQP